METVKREKILIFILIIVNLVGIIGISIPQTQAYLLPFSPFNLLISFIFICINQKRNSAFFKLCLWVFCLGISVEILGVQTGLIFGDYAYGATLGFKILGTPLMIGVNWLLCILSVGSVLHSFKFNKWVKIVLGSSLLVILDFLIEPVAMHLDFWNWKNGVVPLQNYVAWWIISAVMLLTYYHFSFEKSNRMAILQFFIFWLFFGLLNLTLF